MSLSNVKPVNDFSWFPFLKNLKPFPNYGILQFFSSLFAVFRTQISNFPKQVFPDFICKLPQLLSYHLLHFLLVIFLLMGFQEGVKLNVSHNNYLAILVIHFCC
jgi:hypothetical protein